MLNWQKMYNDRCVSAAEAAATVNSGDQIWFPIGAAEPYAFVKALTARQNSLTDVTTHQILPVRPGYFDKDTARHIRHNSLFTSGVTREAVREGWADFTPNHFHEIPRLIREYWDVDVAGAAVSPMDDHGFFSLGLGADYIWEAIHKGKKVVLEVNPAVPRCYGNCHVHISKVTHLIECNDPLPELHPAPLSEIDKTIGGYVAELIDDGVTLQIGYGTVPDAICNALRDKKDLGIHTEMVTEGIMKLVACGAVNNSRKNFHPDKMLGTFAWGTKRLYDFMNCNPMLELHPVDYTNDPYNIGRNDNMISINATISVDFLGQCCSESMGEKQWSGTGGQVDFFRGANISKGGKGFVTMPSTAKGGTVSRIVPVLKKGSVVTTSKNDVDHIVTEYGVAKMRGQSVRQRTLSLIRISHPDFRRELTEAARKLKLI